MVQVASLCGRAHLGEVGRPRRDPSVAYRLVDLVKRLPAAKVVGGVEALLLASGPVDRRGPAATGAKRRTDTTKRRAGIGRRGSAAAGQSDVGEVIGGRADLGGGIVLVLGQIPVLPGRFLAQVADLLLLAFDLLKRPVDVILGLAGVSLSGGLLGQPDRVRPAGHRPDRQARRRSALLGILQPAPSLGELTAHGTQPLQRILLVLLERPDLYARVLQPRLIAAHRHTGADQCFVDRPQRLAIAGRRAVEADTRLALPPRDRRGRARHHRPAALKPARHPIQRRPRIAHRPRRPIGQLDRGLIAHRPPPRNWEASVPR